MGKVKRTICIIMAALTVASAPMVSYMEAQAGELVLELSLLDQLLIMFGINAGLGEQYEWFHRQDTLTEMFEAAAEGGTAELPNYGTVNFSETQSLKEWFEWSLDCQKFLLGNLSVINPENAARYMEAGKALDEVSYNNSGTCATNALDDGISAFYDDYNGSSEALAEDIRSCFTVINGGGGFNDDNDDDEEKAARRQKFWKTFFAVTAAGMLSVGNAAVPYAALKEYGNSEFNEYDAVFGEGGFSDYEVSGGMYHVVGTTRQVNNENAYTIKKFDATVSDKVAAVYDGSIITFYSLTRGYPLCNLSGSGIIYENGKVKHEYTFSDYSTYCVDGAMSFNIPVFRSMDSLKAYAVSSNASDILNLKDPKAYANFKSKTGTADAVIGNPLSGYVGALKSLVNLIDIIPSLREASDTYGGTSEMLPEIARIISEGRDIAIGKPDVDDPSSSASYSGILSKILAAINSLPYGILNAFTSKFMTADKLTQLINNLPVLFVEAFSGMIELSLQPIINAINLVPASMQARLAELFPNSIAVGNAIIDFPDAVARAVKGIAVNVPEIKIPEITIPEITIPDFNVEVNPAITLDPSYNISVNNDYTGLGGIIINAVNDAATELFVPDQDLALEKIDDMKEYFEFVDEIKTKIALFLTDLAGIHPSPYLKIPLGKVKDTEYSYGFGDYWVTDCTWYIPYKNFGDGIILCLFWAVFLWQLFIKLPGIISGVSGSVDGVYSSWYRYLDTKGPARIEGKKG